MSDVADRPSLREALAELLTVPGLEAGRVVDRCFRVTEPEPVRLPDAGALASSSLAAGARREHAVPRGARRRAAGPTASPGVSRSASRRCALAGRAARRLRSRPGPTAAPVDVGAGPRRPGGGRRRAQQAAGRGGGRRGPGGARRGGGARRPGAHGGRAAPRRPRRAARGRARGRRAGRVARWRTTGAAATTTDVAVTAVTSTPSQTPGPPARTVVLGLRWTDDGWRVWDVARPLTSAARPPRPRPWRGRRARGRSRWRPAPRGRRGSTRAPPTRSRRAPSRSANAGTGTAAGRWNAAASAATTSALRAGAVTRLTGPCTSAVSRCSIARTSSSSVIHGQNCRPDPSRPPTPALMQRQQGSQRAAARPEHDPGAQVHDADAGLGGGRGRRLPLPHDVREERGADRLVLVEHVLAAGAVGADPRRLQQHLRAVVELGERPRQQAGGQHARRQDLALAGRGQRPRPGVRRPRG